MNTYQLIDSGNFQKLEQIGPYRMVRPSPQAVWRPRLPASEWKRDVDVVFKRFSGGDGKWTVLNKRLDREWFIDYGGLNLKLKRTDFGHLGVFAEQISNWQTIRSLSKPDMEVLNLFAYTGGSSLAAAQGGAKVVHVDASKTSVAWARENAEANQLADHPIRWIVDDAQKFVAKEARRGRRYHGVILDPPSFGRGSKNEVWKIEEHLSPLLDGIKEILHEDFKFILLSSHSHGYTPVAMKNNLLELVGDITGEFQLSEMLVEEQDGGRALPSGASCFFIRN
ncbi:class I SAM-dependent methyltransferase [Pseudobacteriovorax antillogorgiicola]|uniref:23S rRNA (Cytosine1962-C5)-methyltransferase n=1 Tax=Pseudobacteriovorax antillogorgiicola TaxID=1513793 RepID=A0A1Y6B4Z5_9BACT|nr:class I SAM-dependent methyltransferase [Pseudobacteriovorax antillogorgiicola]TCS59471.1 23S rRNA (cytosine1962-C5)-methyltransferase [Pseudobacteriovorax antillogorgiicola]SME88055.1 23S rRNA (cytosine1962-C5)-methyltransferase [Pseudobacteriovorax antillogorgiicola]